MNDQVLAGLAEGAALELMRQHEVQQRFDGLGPPWTPETEHKAYLWQDAYVNCMSRTRKTAVCGYKIALTTPSMRKMVGFDEPVSGRLLADLLHQSGDTVHVSAYGRLIVEFELAFRMKKTLPATDAAWTAEMVLPYVGAVFPALEVADDRHADYSSLNRTILTLVADNAWNQGLVLGSPVGTFTLESLGNASGTARIDGQDIGCGSGRDVMGHPLNALAWLANHLQSRKLQLRENDLVTTGSLLQSTFPVAGSLVKFTVEGLGSVSLSIQA
jgi:2-keto-4-pentenoate hydratase